VNFGYLLRTLRICAGLSLRELARNIDVSPTYLSLIENGKQPPPSPPRIAKIEEILKVPVGSLLSISSGFDPAILSFLQNTPEAIDFLSAAKEKRLSAATLMELTSFITTHGEDRLRQALEVSSSCSTESAACGKPSCNVYVWPYLEENLVFDLKETTRKEIFLEQAVSHICCHCNGVSPRLILEELLRREKIASTGIGHGIAVPHAYVSGLDRMIVAFVRIPEGLEFHSIDGEPVQMALLLAGPRSSKNLHLLLLSRIARLVRNQSFCRRVLCAENAREIISVFREMEAAVP
jgi:PTS system nitrogen regulatory IIA component